MEVKIKKLLILFLLWGCTDPNTEVNELYGNWQLTFGTVATDTSYKETSYDTLSWELIYSIKEDSITTHWGDDNYSTYTRYYEQVDDSVFVYAVNSQQELQLHRSYLYDIINKGLIDKISN
jgi:hypothetical protein